MIGTYSVHHIYMGHVRYTYYFGNGLGNLVVLGVSMHACRSMVGDGSFITMGIGVCERRSGLCILLALRSSSLCGCRPGNSSKNSNED